MEGRGLKLWPHQQRGITETVAYIDAGEQATLLTSPTGGGKSRMMVGLMREANSRGWGSVLYASRKMLIEQLAGVLDSEGMRYGVRAASLPELQDDSQTIQVASIPTEYSRVYRKMERSLHDAKLVIVDEAHMQKASQSQKIINEHKRQGSHIVGLTATPLHVNHIYNQLVVAGNNTEMRQCGAHVPCYVFAPDEPDTSKLVRKQKTGEFQYNEKKFSVWTQSVVGSVIEQYVARNPERKPGLLFAPCVKSSIWFCDRLNEAGIRAAHIDGDSVYRGGEEMRSSRELREEAVADLKAGRLHVICNRFVLREGIDIQELYHLILATPIGSLLSYIQTVGRVLRFHPTLDSVIVQDHGGNFWRHGSPNMDRDWRSTWHLTDYVISSARQEQMRENKEPEPIVCPQCKAVRRGGGECYDCGFKHTKSKRMVIQENGELKQVTGKILRKKPTAKKANTVDKWTRTYYRMKRANKTFRQAMGLFQHENGYRPPKDLPLMPKNEMDWYQKVGDVPTDRLN